MLRLFFDLDDTLLDHSRASREAARHLRVAFPGLSRIEEARFLDDWVVLTERHMDRFFRGEVDFVEQRRGRMKELLSWADEAIDDAEADAAFETYLRSYRTHWALFEDATRCLDALDAADVWLGLITNGKVEAQTRKLERTGLLGRFEVVVITAELGVHKPARRVFDVAAERAGAPAERCVYVGDKLDSDARAAAAAGWRGVWLDRRRSEERPGDVERVTSLDEVVALFAR